MDGKVGTAVRPVILSGGSGSRLWPMSRELFPKQLQALLGTRTMLQEAVERVSGPAFEAPMVVCNDSHRFIIAEQMRQMGVTPGEIVLEPVARNSAPAIAVGALRALERFADPLILVLAADHRIGDVAAFRAAVAAAVPVAAAGHLVAFGITPTGPATASGSCWPDALRQPRSTSLWVSTTTPWPSSVPPPPTRRKWRPILSVRCPPTSATWPTSPPGRSWPT